MSAIPHVAANDDDAFETREWLDALESVLEREGAERAHYLLEALIDKARRSGARIRRQPPGAIRFRPEARCSRSRTSKA